VLFAHGSGAAVHSPRNNYVPGYYAIAVSAPYSWICSRRRRTWTTKPVSTFHADRRLQAATQWIKSEKTTQNLPVGYFGASTGAAAALQAAARMGDSISAVVSRGGRPDMAGKHDLENVNAHHCCWLEGGTMWSLS